jgi:hypothetical protein
MPEKEVQSKNPEKKKSPSQECCNIGNYQFAQTPLLNKKHLVSQP